MPDFLQEYRRSLQALRQKFMRKMQFRVENVLGGTEKDTTLITVFIG